MRNIYRLFNKIRNIISWLPTLWNIDWYEYDTFYNIMHFTISKMIKHFENHNIKYVGMERDIQLMKTCVRLIDKISQDYYNEQAINEIEEKYGELIMTTTPTENDSKSYYANLDYQKIIVTKEDDDNDRKQIRLKWYNKAIKAERLLYKILNEKINHWWI